jgi:hypothetical protein
MKAVLPCHSHYDSYAETAVMFRYTFSVRRSMSVTT